MNGRVGAAPTPVRRVGRFELRRVLGRGAQATVWLGHDPRLDREVAVKLLNPGADDVALHRWLHEARAVSRLAHPNIVPVFEADETEGQAYLVFEWVEGPTLAQLLASRGALPPDEAVQTMLGVLDALAAAHAQGIVHRDLKPSNILIGPDGRARVMDFGIAARVAWPGAGPRDGRIVGTPGYLSPEAARGEAPVPTMDVFSAGMVLGELLAGGPLLRERDTQSALRRVQEEDMRLPPGCAADDTLRAVIARALAREAADRYDGAAAMHRALSEWQRPQENAQVDGGAANGTLDFLLRRMRHKGDFPALSASVTQIQRVAGSEHEGLESLAQEVLKDVALTNKLLRMVNTVRFSQTGGGGVSTVSRAVALVGFAGIRNMALSLVLLERMHDKAHADQLKEEFLRSLMAAQLAHELSLVSTDAEEAFIGALLQNLGRLLTGFYFPEEAVEIRTLLKTTPGRGLQAAPPLGEAAASVRVLGTSFDALGQGVARHWGLPDGLCQCMRKPSGAAPGRLLERGPERLRWVCAAANEAADLLLAYDPDAAAPRIAALADRLAVPLGLTRDALRDAVELARGKVVQMAQAMSIGLPPASPARRLLIGGTAKGDVAAAGPDSLTGHELHATQPFAATLPVAPAAARREEASQLLSAGIQDITNSMVDEHFKLDAVLRMVLETMLRALQFRRVVFCLRDARGDTLSGRFGLGEGAADVAAVFKVALRADAGAPADLFSAVCQKGADTLITDASVPAIARRLPAWHRRHANAPAFLLLPMQLKGATFALIYADKAQPGAIELDERELNLLRTLRNQAIMAFRQAG
ncbi:MAG TPA: HDOD domain-containing protein [Rubrivivax sp.]